MIDVKELEEGLKIIWSFKSIVNALLLDDFQLYILVKYAKLENEYLKR